MPTPQPWAADPLVKIITNTVTQHAMIAKGDHVLAGVSGGPDSVVLVHILSALRDSLHFTLGGAYLNHGLRPAAARHEIELVSALARRLGFELHIGEIGPLSGGGSLEEQLRLQRYSFFNGTAAAHGYTKIAVGHHADDNAEAVLMRFLRGSGLLGLAGIAPVRDNIIRPLIHLRREQVLAFLKRYGVAWAEDASNADQRFVRNRVRHHLLPLLKQHYNPNIVNTLNRVAGVCLEEERHLDLSLQPLLTEAVLSAEADRLELGLAAFNRSPRPVQRRLLRMALDQWQGHIRQLGVKHVDAVLDLLSPDKLHRCVHLPGSVRVRRDACRLHVQRVPGLRAAAAQASDADYLYRMPALDRPQGSIDILEAACTLCFEIIPPPPPQNRTIDHACEILLDADQVQFPLIVRNYRQGDRIRPFGLAGTQSLKRLFINNKVPRTKRRRLPLLLNGGQIVWAVGLRRGRCAPITRDTIRAVRVTAAEWRPERA